MQHCKMKQKNQKGYNFVQKRMLKIKIILQQKKKFLIFFQSISNVGTDSKLRGKRDRMNCFCVCI